MRWFTGIMALAAIVTLIIQLATCNKKTILELPEGIKTQECKKHSRDSIYIEALRVVYSTDTLQKPTIELKGDTAFIKLPPTSTKDTDTKKPTIK